MASWDILIWCEGNKCDFVPSSWAVNPDKTSYIYPITILSNIKRSIYLCEPPNKNLKYSEFKAVYKSTVHSTSLAEKFVKKFESNCINMDESPCKSDEKVDNKLHQIIEMLAQLQADVKEIKESQGNLSIRLNYILSKEAAPKQPEKCPFNLPIKNNDELEEMEKMLEKDPQPLINRLSLIGGKTLRRSITYIIRKVLTRHMALEYSTKGKKGKKNFSLTKLFTAVFDSARNANPDASDVQITQTIGYVLASAKDWDGGYYRRKNIKLEKVNLN